MTGFSTPSTSLSDYADAALSQAVAAMRPGWIVLRDCMLGPDGSLRPARVQYAFLHAQVGIALLDVVPGPTAANAVERLRRQFVAAGFGVEFLSTLQIRYLCVPLRAIADLSWLLDQEFSRQPSSKPPQNDAWVATAQSLLLAQPLQEQPRAAARRADYQSQQSHLRMNQQPAKRPRSVGPMNSARWLVFFWGFIGTTVGGGVLLLEYLGPPTERASLTRATGPGLALDARSPRDGLLSHQEADGVTKGAPALPVNFKGTAKFPAWDTIQISNVIAEAQGPIDADPQRAIIENEQAITELQRRLKRFEPEIDSNLGIDASTLAGPSDRPLTALTPPPDRGPLASAPTLAGEVEDPSTPVVPLAEGAAASVTNSVLQPAHDPSDDTAALSPVDGPMPSPRGDESISPEVHPASAAAMLEPAATSPDMLPDNLQDRAAAATVTVTSPIPPTAKQDPILAQSPSALLDRDASVSLPEPASTAKASVLLKATSPHRPEITPLRATPTATLTEMMIHRADALLQRADISAARLLYERAAAAGSGHAATAMGKTFDATFLSALGVTGVGTNPALATAWYRRAVELGDPEARIRLQAAPPETSRTSLTEGMQP